jgi:hypothetical protein
MGKKLDGKLVELLGSNMGHCELTIVELFFEHN